MPLLDDDEQAYLDSLVVNPNLGRRPLRGVSRGTGLTEPLLAPDGAALLDRTSLIPPDENWRTHWTGLPPTPNYAEASVAAPIHSREAASILPQMRDQLRGTPNPMYAPSEVQQITQDALLGPAGAWGGIIGGVRGATQGATPLMRTLRDSLPVAQAEHAASPNSPNMVSNDTIWRNRGWQLFPDGQWRMEIPDDGAVVTQAAATGQVLHNVPLEQVLSHPDAYGAYPDLRRIQTSVNVPATHPSFQGNTTRAFWEPDAALPGGGRIVVREGVSGDELRRVLLHEMQHGVQRMEGHAPGTSTRNSPVQQRSAADLDTVKAERAEIIRDRTAYFAERAANARAAGHAEPSTTRMFDEWEAAHPTQTQRLKQLDDYIHKGIGRPSDYDYYRRALGEVEARAVEARVRNPSLYQSQSPYSTMVTGPSGTLSTLLWDPRDALLRVRRPYNLLEGPRP